MEKINEKIGGWLLKPGNTRKLMASKLGITTESLTNKITGETPWLWSEICAVAELINCSLEDIR